MGNEAFLVAERHDEVQVLSGYTSNYAVSDEVRQILCLTTAFDKLTLYVSNAHRSDHRVLAFIERLRRDGKTFKQVMSSIEDIAKLYQGASNTNKHLEMKTEHSSLQTQILDLLTRAAAVKASDIHIDIGEQSTSIRVRIHGRLRKFYMQGIGTREDGIAVAECLYNTMCESGAEPMLNVNKSQDGSLKADFLSKTSGINSVRLATSPTRDKGLYIVLRLTLDRGQHRLSLAHLQYSPTQIEQINDMIRRRGIRIASGPTGSGKTTLLDCMLNGLMEHERFETNLITIEDPIENPIKGAIQTQLRCDKSDPDAIAQGWIGAMRQIMRQDPDDIMIGEIRDSDTARAAIRAAITGHGVYSTVHTHDACSILERLRDLGVEEHLLYDPALMTGLINQNLVRTLCSYCKRPLTELQGELNPDLIKRLQAIGELDQMYVVGPGCEHCQDELPGIGGRQPVAEIIIPTLGFMNTYRQEGKAFAKAYWVKNMRGQTKAVQLAALILAGRIDPRHAEQDVCPLDDDQFSIIQ